MRFCPRHSKVLYLTLWGDRQGFAVALHLRIFPPLINIKSFGIFPLG